MLMLSTLALVIAAIGMWWRLRRHLHQSDEALNQVLEQIESETKSEAKPEHESVEP